VLNITIIDGNLVNNAYYGIRNTSWLIGFFPYNGINLIPIPQHVWDAEEEGTFLIIIIVIDAAGNRAQLYITVTKELPAPPPPPSPAIPLDNYYLIFTGLSIFAIVVINKKKLSITKK